VRVLAAFAKVAVAAGESADVTVALTARSLASWDTALKSWRVGGGRRTLAIGHSAVDLPHRVTIDVPAQLLPTPQR
jgi:beta-glucosidase